MNSLTTGTAITTPAPVTPSVQLAPSTIVLTQATMSALLSDDAGVLAWNAPVPAQASALVAGDVLVGPTSTADPGGLLAKVSSVTSTSSSLVVTTTLVTLTDAFSNLSAADRRGD